MSLDVSDLGGVGLRVDDHILTVEVELHEPRDGWPDFATVVSHPDLSYESLLETS